jgi:hypothetical protein
MDSLRMSTKNVQTKATELENSDAGKEMLEKDKMYTDLNKAAVNLNETLVEMKNDADE